MNKVPWYRSKEYRTLLIALFFVGLALLFTGFFLFISGMTHFFRMMTGEGFADTDFGIPKEVWYAFVGIPMMGFGGILCKIVFFGAIAGFFAAHADDNPIPPANYHPDARKVIPIPPKLPQDR